ncbi:MAG: K(+)-transporting ATPase subunit C [Actinomycetia bacterium]|nr:K(+)-transporting ATPase subunit C [Actinomycetes bacterium]
MKNFLRQLRPALIALAILTVICGGVYPLVVTAVGQVAFNDEAEGSLIKVDGVVVGSELIGQQFVSPQYFHPRPSAAGAGYDSGASSGSNLGPRNPALLDAVAERVAEYRTENGLSNDVLVPVDAVTASASGLDPHISIANARLQASRVADVRGLDVALVLQMIGDHTDDRNLLVLGDPGVNVLELNLALDRLTS